MKNMEIQIQIHADAKRVWYVLWDTIYYAKWTSVFVEGSHVVSDWKEGGKIHFLSPQGGGMYSIITVNKPYEKMQFQHVGEIKNFQEQPLREETQKWTGAKETYLLSTTDDTTTLTAQMEMAEVHANFFSEVMPKALAIVKQLAEQFVIIVTIVVNAPLQKIWEAWTNTKHIQQWNKASEDWHTPYAENDLKVGGKFLYRMEAKDKSLGFDFEGVYTKVEDLNKIEYTILGGRKICIAFEEKGNEVIVTESFEPEDVNALEIQKTGWQSIVNNFKKYVEAL